MLNLFVNFMFYVLIRVNFMQNLEMYKYFAIERSCTVANLMISDLV